MNSKPIGIFDSGSGGLTVLEEVQKQLPQESVIYYGDLARVPFGSKSKEEIVAINEEIISYLISRDVKMVIVACNTSSANALQEDKAKFDLPVVGLIEPGAQMVLETTINKKVGIIATEGTVNSHAYKNIIQNKDSRIEVFEQACPKFVPLIEANNVNDKLMEAAIEEYLRPLINQNVDTVVHGCTHYPLIEQQIRKITKDNIQFVNPAVATVGLAKDILLKESLLGSGPADYEYIATKIEEGKYVRVDGRGEFFGSTPAA